MFGVGFNPLGVIKGIKGNTPAQDQVIKTAQATKRKKKLRAGAAGAGKSIFGPVATAGKSLLGG